MQVLDDSTYEKDLPSRRAMYPYEKQLLISCLDHLSLTREDYADQIRRCGPLSESTKQSLEINEEDHGKAIMIFTIVTIIFLPLSFVTSYLGMNTSDIRDMESRQSLFWSIAIPLTAVTMGSILFISYRRFLPHIGRQTGPRHHCPRNQCRPTKTCSEPRQCDGYPGLRQSR
jgi:Mg2+ and Co2+ transporter CorA